MLKFLIIIIYIIVAQEERDAQRYRRDAQEGDYYYKVYFYAKVFCWYVIQCQKFSIIIVMKNGLKKVTIINDCHKVCYYVKVSCWYVKIFPLIIVWRTISSRRWLLSMIIMKFIGMQSFLVDVLFNVKIFIIIDRRDAQGNYYYFIIMQSFLYII